MEMHRIRKKEAYINAYGITKKKAQTEKRNKFSKTETEERDKLLCLPNKREKLYYIL